MTEPRYDVVIVGAGPVGLMFSDCLARWGYKIKHIDNRPEPTRTGRADGIQPRSLDVLRNMGLKRAIMAHDPARVYEVAFWDPEPATAGKTERGIIKSGSTASCPKFIDARYPFTTLLHQGYIEKAFLDDMAKYGVEVQRPWHITGFENDGKDSVYPVRVEITHVDGNKTESLRSKYLFGGEGARSFVRQQLGIPIHHKDPIAHVWGVMDGVVITDFPDIKLKCTIHSDYGSIMVIPRENNMVRLYIQIASSTDPDFNPRKTATEEEVISAAKKILRPYSIEWERVEWFSVYPIGQGIAERYTLDERVFLGGDAVHTHSPKAGQGMNTAFHDAVNLAWKIHHVESGFASRSILNTYESERKHVAEELLDFDAKYAALFSKRPPSASETDRTSNSHQSSETEENEFVKTLKSSAEFTSGYGVTYNPNVFNWSPSSHTTSQHPLFLHPDTHAPGTTLRPGRILVPATVTRVADANVVHLEHEMPFNGAWRLYIFAGVPSSATRHSLRDFAAALATEGDVRLSRGSEAAVAAAKGRQRPFWSTCTVFACAHTRVDRVADVPAPLERERVYADDVWDHRVPDAQAAAHAKMGIDVKTGAIVVVRPDGYVGCVVRLEGRASMEALRGYFAGFMDKIAKPSVLQESARI